MNDAMLDDIAIEKACKERFGLNLDIVDVIVRAVPVSVAAKATVFVAANHQIYTFIASQSGLVLDDVRKIIQRMQTEAEQFVPPFSEADYFDRIGREKFKVMFPGKPIVSDEDIRYYKNLAPYNPALVRIAKVKGEIRGYDAASKMWRKVRDYTYNKINPA